MRMSGFRTNLNHVSDIVIEFAYENWVGKVGIHDYDQIITHCYIFEVPKDSDTVDMEKEYLLADGDAICHPFDQFNKRVGRKIALTRALKLMTSKYGMTKDFRKFIWEEYFKRSPKSKVSLSS